MDSAGPCRFHVNAERKMRWRIRRAWTMSSRSPIADRLICGHGVGSRHFLVSEKLRHTHVM
ncbi:hypothetical protein Mapa_001634 [Marchantia paleacea]|nr:hypothetical protein Mapa_001634 [Marchantia paleacea]